MSREWKPGDRVRVTARYRGEYYPPGDKGTVALGPMDSAGGTRCYFVAMDQGGTAGKMILFTEDEIEPDV
jgi:hypothetical protein